MPEPTKPPSVIRQNSAAARIGGATKAGWQLVSTMLSSKRYTVLSAEHRGGVEISNGLAFWFCAKCGNKPRARFVFLL
jgi:hypothetical protein